MATTDDDDYGLLHVALWARPVPVPVPVRDKWKSQQINSHLARVLPLDRSMMVMVVAVGPPQSGIKNDCSPPLPWPDPGPSTVSRKNSAQLMWNF